MYVRDKERKAKTTQGAQRRNSQHEPLSFNPQVKGQGSKFGALPVQDLAYKWCSSRSSRLFRSIHQTVISLLRQSLLAHRHGSHRQATFPKREDQRYIRSIRWRMERLLTATDRERRIRKYMHASTRDIFLLQQSLASPVIKRGLNSSIYSAENMVVIHFNMFASLLVQIRVPYQQLRGNLRTTIWPV